MSEEKFVILKLRRKFAEAHLAQIKETMQTMSNEDLIYRTLAAHLNIIKEEIRYINLIYAFERLVPYKQVEPTSKNKPSSKIMFHYYHLLLKNSLFKELDDSKYTKDAIEDMEGWLNGKHMNHIWGEYNL